MDWLRQITEGIKPIKTLFAFYVFMFVVPLVIPFWFAPIALKAFSADAKNSIPLMGLLVCVIVIIGWTTFFLIYFTRERTKNPKLYGKGFISGLPITNETTTSAEVKSEQE